MWLRRDLRLHDNAALYHALKENDTVQSVFIFDEQDNLNERQVSFVHGTLSGLKSELEKAGSSLMLLTGDPVELFKSLKPRVVYANHDYKRRELPIDNLKTYKDQVIFEKSEVVKDDGTPYTVFTPYSRKWKASLKDSHTKSYPVEKYLDIKIPPRIVKQDLIKNYHNKRDFPSENGTTRMSAHLRFGTVSIRELMRIALKENEVWLNELIWREFYQMILWHFPYIKHRAFKSAYDNIPWRNNETEFHRWCEGQTGYPIVDAGMRELAATGFMHNRVRMITASFLTKHLLIDWRWGEAWFAEQLLDYDLASNNGGWQWAAGSGCDAAPYFRIFNPTTQTEKFDPEMKYVRKWVPEVDSDRYPKPIVEHTFARNRALEAYKKALA